MAFQGCNNLVYALSKIAVNFPVKSQNSGIIRERGMRTH